MHGCNHSLPGRVIAFMKLLSLPVIFIGVAVIAVAGGLIYATSGYTDYRQPKALATVQGDSPQTATDGAPASTDGTATPVSPVTADTSSTPGQGPQGQWGGGNRGGGTPEEREQRRQQRMQQMATELGLSDAQKQQMQDIRKNITDREQRRAAIMAILTPEQQTKMEQMRAQRQNRGGNGEAPGAQSPPPNSVPATTSPKSGT